MDLLLAICVLQYLYLREVPIFADSAIKRRWYVKGEGWQIDEFTVDFRVGRNDDCKSVRESEISTDRIWLVTFL